MISDSMRSLVEELVLRPDAPGDIVEFSSDMAQIRMESGEAIWLMHTPSEELYPKLHEFLSTLVAGRALARARVVMLGGKDSVEAILEDARPGRFARGELYVHHLRVDGSWWHGSGKEKSPDVVAGFERASSESRAERFDDGRFMFALSEALERGRLRRREMDQFRNQYDKSAPIATYILMGAMALFFGFEILFGGTTYTPTLYRMGANLHGALGEDFDWWRLLASVFLHAGFMHLAFNTYVVYALGSFLERILGAGRYLTLVALSGLFGSIASYFLSQGSLSVGASGAFWGFLGASAALGLRPGTLIPPMMVGHLKRVAIFNLLINLGVSALPNIDMWAHFGGGIMGFVLVGSGLLQKGLGPMGQESRQTERGRRVSTGLATVLSLLMIASIGMAWKEGRPWELIGAPEMSYQSVDGTDFQWLVPQGWAERDGPSAPGYMASVAYGHLLRNGGEFGVEIRGLEESIFSPAEAEASLQAIQIEMGKGEAAVQWVDSDIPYLRQEWVFPAGLRIKCLRIAHGTIQIVTLDSFLDADGNPLAIEPEVILESIRLVTKQ